MLGHMMNKCPFFGRCGGCKFDFCAADYRTKKVAELRGVRPTDEPVWCTPGARRRADFAFAGGVFGFFALGSKDIVSINNCLNLVPEINAVLPQIATLPWGGAGSCLVTACDNGIDIAINADVPYYSSEFRAAVQKLPVLRVVWNGRVIMSHGEPFVSFGDKIVPYISGAFLQPTVFGADIMRKMVTDAAAGAKRVADLFCGLGNFTYALNADGFDILGVGVNRDLFKKPLTLGMLNGYDCVVMDPPRAGADAQCKILAKSNVERVIYVSCNPATFMRDANTLTHGGYRMTRLIPIDQFIGSSHWEIFSIFTK